MKKNESFSLVPLGGEKKKVIVIGGGVTGALSAFELAQAGHEVVLIEAKGLGNGSSSRSAACIRQQFGTPSTVKGMIYSTAFYKNWSNIVGGEISPLTQNGYLFLKGYHTNMNDLEALVKMQKDAGLEDVKLLSPEDICELFPYLEVTGVKCATWCPSDGFLDPVIVYADAASAAEKFGAVIIKNDEVIDAEFSNGNVVGVKTRSGKIFYGDIFVNAAGAWSPRISSIFNGYPIDVKTRKRYLYFLDGYENEMCGEFLQAKDFHNLPMVITPNDCYFRPEGKAGYQLMMGWAHPTKPLRPSFEAQDEIEPGFTVQCYGEALRKEVTQFLPDAESGKENGMRRIFSVTSGFYEDTPDHNPLIGYDPWVSNLIHVTGFSGHGLMHAPISSLLVAHLVNSSKNLQEVELPLGLGRLDTKTFHVDREFKHSESMVI